MKIVQDRFLEYIRIDTQSNPEAAAYPSTQGQRVLADILAAECRAIGLTEVEQWAEGYVTATLPANTDVPCPVIGFLAHMDTSPDCAGVNVSPQVIPNYDGGDVLLGNGLVLSPREFPALETYRGQTLITTDGTTLLGADDKAGIAEILTAMEFLLANPQIPHGTIRVAFTPDEEIGRGVDFFDTKRFGAEFGYTIDGMTVGELECENFNAARAVIRITGKSVHPGYAKGVMVNAAQVAADIAAKFPAEEIPAKTGGREGFFHLVHMQGGVERAELVYILRDFTKAGFNERKDFVIDAVAEVNRRYGRNAAVLNLYDEYFNMAEVLDEKPHIAALAEKAMCAAGVEPVFSPIRGGTDGARLAFMGLPCPNIFTGGQNAHGPYEFISVEAMEKAVDVVVNIARLACEAGGMR